MISSLWRHIKQSIISMLSDILWFTVWLTNVNFLNQAVTKKKTNKQTTKKDTFLNGPSVKWLMWPLQIKAPHKCLLFSSIFHCCLHSVILLQWRFKFIFNKRTSLKYHQTLAGFLLCQHSYLLFLAIDTFSHPFMDHSIDMVTGVAYSVKLWAMPCWATQDTWVIVKCA